jgi:hypothetical protein
MANEEHMKLLSQGVAFWNKWRREHIGLQPDLKGTYLASADFSGADFVDADFRDSNLALVNLSAAKLHGAQLRGANLRGAKILGADLKIADLRGVRFVGADLRGANLRGAYLHRANLAGADLRGADFNGADLMDTIFADVDLREAEGLDRVQHAGPSEISVSTIYRSEGQIPVTFLRGCGMPESLIVQIPALVAGLQPIQFYSCFISYSGQDEEFARRLRARMQEAELRVWFAPEDIKGGDKLYDQIDCAIQVHDRLLLVLSESSMQSKWVVTEIRRARKVELREGRRKLFPIRLMSFEALHGWACIDSTTGEDMAEEVRSYFIPDFSNWKNHDDFERAFARLLADLKASA